VMCSKWKSSKEKRTTRPPASHAFLNLPLTGKLQSARTMKQPAVVTGSTSDTKVSWKSKKRYFEKLSSAPAKSHGTGRFQLFTAPKGITDCVRPSMFVIAN